MTKPVNNVMTHGLSGEIAISKASQQSSKILEKQAAHRNRFQKTAIYAKGGSEKILIGYKMKIHIFVLILLLYCGYIHGQSTTQGKDFWVSFGNNAKESSSSLSLQVRIVATNAANVKFTFTETGYTETIALVAGSVYTRDLSSAEKYAVYASMSGISQKSLHIESDENIAVYAINLLEATTDATGILPINAYDTSYYHLSYYNLNGYYDGYVIIAVENNTNIYDDNVLVATLNRGEVYANYFDHTTKHITTDKPVAYFTTNSCVRVPPSVTACDCLYEQLLPESLWGISFMVPVTIRGIERIRIYAAQDNTTITHSGGTVMSGSLNLNSGEYVELEINRNEAGCYIESNRPVAVASYLTGLDFPGLSYYNGDPAMAWIPSIDQLVKETTIAPFIASGSSILSEHHILIIAPTAYRELTEMRIGNGAYSPLAGGVWLNHPSGYSFYSMPLNNADESYGFRNSAGLAILGYGLGNYESYYYLAGSALRKLDASLYVNNIHNQDMEGQIFCADSVAVRAVVHYIMHTDQGHLRWYIDGVEETAFEDRLEWYGNLSGGKHEISMIVKKENGVSDTVRSSFMIEDIIEIEIADTTICQEERVKLQIKNTSDELVYLWFYDAYYKDTIVKATLLETDILDADTMFYIGVVTSGGCISRDTVTISVNPLPELISKDTSVCYNSIATPTASSSDAVSITWYGDANYSSIIVANNSFETAALKADTMFYVEAVSVNGCILRDSVKVTVHPLPELTIDNHDIEICYNQTAIPIASSSDAVSVTWYSDANYSNIIISANSFETAALTADTMFYVEAVSANGCISRDSVKVTVHPLPELIVDNHDMEICYNQTVVPTASGSDAVSVTWYGDANYSNIIISANSFETAALKADTMFYVEAVSANGCISRDSVKVTVHPLPELIVDNHDMEICYNQTVVPTASGSDAVSITWYGDANYSNIIVANNSFETAALKADTMFYVEAVSANGCISRDSVKIIVYPLPELTVDNHDMEICYNQTVVPIASSSDAVSVTWYGDANYSNIIVANNSFETAALKADTMFYVEAVSANGCILRDSVKVTVHSLPELLVNNRDTVCLETSALLNVSSSDAVSIAWYGDADYSDLIGYDASYQTAALTADTVFYVESMSNKGCTTRDSINVFTVAPPAIVAMDDYHLCYGEEVTLTTLQSDGMVNWNVEPTTVSPVSTQQYIVTASRYPCPDAKDTVTVTVGDSLYILPDILPEYKPNDEYSQQLTSNVESPKFTVANGNLLPGLFLNTSGMLSGTLPMGNNIFESIFTIRVEDIHGCTAEKEYTVEKGLFIPKIFTPNGDGINDIFMPGYNITVFDRLGIEIFKGDNGWDGTYKGKLVPFDIYFYVLHYTDIKGKTVVKSGYIGITGMESY
jgi:gliding motility-associated-like protein